MQLTLVSNGQRIAALMARLWESQGHGVTQMDQAELGPGLARRLHDVDPTAIVWAATPMSAPILASLCDAPAARPIVDLSFVIAPSQLPNELSGLPAMNEAAPRGYVLCLPGRNADRRSGDGISVVLAGDRADAKDVATMLLLATGRRVRDLGPLEAVRFLDHVTLNWFATV